MPESTPLPRPRNSLVELANIVIDNLIKGLGTELTIKAATAYAPWLKWPIIRNIFRQIVTFVHNHLDIFAKRYVDILIIRYQNDARRADYDEALEKIKEPGATDEDIRKAKEAIDSIVRRAK
jgi:hypothetical protein